ncbi:ATP-binding cassette domain-containing protein [Hoylesella buccalis]|uniref:ABC transporter ATP-binding protein n=1 Tax=Hoylesella buccalis DNF00853 TaxID=1401074 RepID=A0A095ZIE2_9BACT|nr:ATP-binding cassette domain-containing protein [Hoylesella buccalis]KGF34131.1 ABC transporter ATP-binding protein [Hoylesella buccalis DNF00853]
METITLNKVLPHVFSHVQGLVSDVWNEEITFHKGHYYLLEANSGKGKSTFCSYLIGYRRDFDGNILFDEQNINALTIKDWAEIRTRHVSYLFQELRLFPELTALENVLIKNNMTHFKTKAQILDWFDELNIADKVNVRIGQMSFGQQQRVALIRSLVQPFDFLLADEPISHLDEDNSNTMAQVLLREATHQGAGVIVTSIGKHLALKYDKVVRL